MNNFCLHAAVTVNHLLAKRNVAGSTTVSVLFAVYAKVRETPPTKGTLPRWRMIQANEDGNYDLTLSPAFTCKDSYSTVKLQLEFDGQCHDSH